MSSAITDGAEAASDSASSEMALVHTSDNGELSTVDDDQIMPTRARGDSMSRASPSASSPIRNSRRRSEQPASRHRVKLSSDASKSSVSSAEDSSNTDNSQVHTPYGFFQSFDSATKGDTSFLNSSLQSINRLKEEKEFVIEDGVLKGGSLTAIVVWLVENGDRQLILAFLACLPRYGLPEQLLGLLVDKFRDHLSDWAETPDQPREAAITSIMQFFSLWLDNHFKRDFQRTQCLATTESVLEEIAAAGFVDWQRRCKLIILRRVGLEPRSLLFTAPSTMGSADDTKSKKGKRLSMKKRSRANSVADGEACFDTLTAADIAEQLTLREWELFRIIPDSDFLDKTWLQKPAPLNNALVQMIDHFNLVSLWVASEIVNTEDLKDRANALKKFTSVCDLLFELGNFNGLMEVVAGLSLGCVQRLHKTWSLAGSGPKAIYEKFCNIMTTKQNFQTYRHALSATKPPAVPYVGVLLKDLIFLEEGNPLRLPNGFFNFDRIHLLGRLLLEIQKYKRISYDIPVLLHVQAFFASIRPPDNDDVLYEASIAVENDAMDSATNPS